MDQRIIWRLALHLSILIPLVIGLYIPYSYNHRHSRNPDNYDIDPTQASDAVDENDFDFTEAFENVNDPNAIVQDKDHVDHVYNELRKDDLNGPHRTKHKEMNPLLRYLKLAFGRPPLRHVVEVLPNRKLEAINLNDIDLYYARSGSPRQLRVFLYD